MRRSNKTRGVSETIGTVLLVGIAVVLVSSVALFMAGNVKEVESVYVSLSSGYTTDPSGQFVLFVENNAGDSLLLSRTTIIVKDGSGADVPGSPFSASDCDYPTTGIGSWDDNDLWSPGETWSKIISPTPTFPLEVKVVYQKANGEKTVVFSESLEAPPSASLPDLAVEEFYFLRYGQRSDEVLVGEPLDLVATVTNLGTAPVPHDNITVQFYDRESYVGDGVLQTPEDDPTPGELTYGETINYIYPSWTVPYPLGIHKMHCRITPLTSGEISTSNNYRYRNLDVSISIVPTRPSGPNPVVSSKDVQLSKTYPKTGDEVTVTLFVKNLGDQPIGYDDDVMLVVSTEPITTEGGEIFNWIDDIPDPEDDDYKEDYENFNPGPPPPDFMPGNTDRDEIWKEVKWAELYGQDLDGNDYTFPTCKIRHLIIPVAGQVSISLTFTARSANPDKILTIYMAVDANPGDYTVLPYDLRGESLPPQRIVFSSEEEGALEGDDPTDNYASLTLQIIPRILLVDDDGAETGSENDVTSHVVESLTGAGVQVDRLFIAQAMTDAGVLRDVPAYEYVDPPTVGAPQMKDYDIVIWVTGKEENPLTCNADATYGGNVEEMMKFLDNGGYLWIVGENVLKGLNEDYMNISPDENGYYVLPDTTSFVKYNTEREDAMIFVRNYLGVKRFAVDKDLPGVIYGETPSNPITGWEGNDSYSVLMDDSAAGADDYAEWTYPLEYGSDTSDPVGMLYVQDYNAPVKEPYGIYHSHEETTPGGETVAYRSVYLPVSPPHVRYLNEKISMAARIMKWFRWELRIGNDLAISKMELVVVEGSYPPKFMDTVEVRVTVRNNGPDTLSTSVEFYVTGPDGIERRITPNFPDPSEDNPRDILNLPGGGGETVVTKKWKATSVGLHTFRAVVDPYHIIQEINEENNDISYSTSTVTSLVAQNNILVVDDDGSWNDTYGPNGDENGYEEDNPNNWRFDGGATEPPEWGMLEDTTGAIVHFLELLGLQYEVYRVVNVFDGENVQIGTGPDVETMKRYNMVIWNCGESGGGGYSGIETITAEDRIEIERYLKGDYREAEYMGNYSEAFLLVGHYILPEIAPNPMYQNGDVNWEFLYNYIGLAGYGNENTGTALYGTAADDVKTHGIVIPTSTVTGLELIKRPDNSGSVDGTPQEDEAGYLYYTDTLDGEDPIAIYLENTGPSYFHTAYLSFSLPSGIFPYLEHRSTEAFYFLLHWFGVVIYQPELYGRNIDISIDDPHPVVGGSYVLSLTVGNYGGVPGGGTVRFMDGRKLIHSTTVFLEPGDEITVEAIWTPLFAGIRQVRVFIDFYNNYDEIFDYINNAPSKSVNIYFFYDDMENGTSNFRHESVVARVNGESPLDFYDPQMETYTDVISSWDEDLSYGVSVDANTSYSHPRSFRLYEPPGGTSRNPLDIVMVLDTSGSMSWVVDGVPKIDRLKDAAKIFISYLTPSDRIAIYTFTNEGYNYPNLFVDWTFCTSENKDDLNDTIDGLWARGWTPLYDTVGAAANKLYPAPSGRIPYLLVFTDGEANRDFNYGPGRYDYENPTDSLGQWMNTYYENYYYSSSAGTSAGNRQGLIMAPFTVYTVGLLSSGYHDSDYPEEEDSDTPPWHTYWQTHNVLTDRTYRRVEYDLWALAHSSGGGGENNGKYYYVYDPSHLSDVFGEIAEEMVSGGEVTRGGSSPFKEGTRGDTRQTETIFSDDVEGGNIGWTIQGQPSSEWEIGDERSHSSSHSWCTRDGKNYRNMVNVRLVSPQISLLQYTSVTLTFWAWYDIESRWDGGIVEISTDGSTWHKLVPDGGYPNTIRSDSSVYNTLCYENGDGAFSSTSSWARTWRQYTVNIPSDYEGVNIYIAFHFASDESVRERGWYIDDIRITGERIAPGQEPPTPPVDPYPPNGELDVPTTLTLSWSGGDDPGGNNENIRYDVYLGLSQDSLTLIASGLTEKYYSLPYTLNENTEYFWKVVARNIVNGRSTEGGLWAFMTGGGGSGGGSFERNEDKYFTVGPFSISGSTSAYLTFWHKYNILPGKNGGVVMLGFRGVDTDGDGPDNTSDIDWLYVTPLTSYSGNLLLTDSEGQPVIWRDDFGRRILWCWNGKSSTGTFDWEFAKVDLLPYVPESSRDEVYVRLYYKQYGQGTGFGWWIDDLEIRVSRSDSLPANASATDKWELYEAVGEEIGKLSRSGTHAWWNHNGEGGDDYLKSGIDNSLITRPIDLTNARWARLSFYTRFNINSLSGAPPDCVRVEVSADNGLTWTAITLGVRWGWGVSGSEYNESGKSMTGIDSGNGWVEASTLSRLSVDLTPWRGFVVLLRFRVVTTNEDGYNHYEDPTSDIKGVLIDDVVVYGVSLLTGVEGTTRDASTGQCCGDTVYLEWWERMMQTYGDPQGVEL